MGSEHSNVPCMQHHVHPNQNNQKQSTNQSNHQKNALCIQLYCRICAAPVVAMFANTAYPATTQQPLSVQGDVIGCFLHMPEGGRPFEREKSVSNIP